MKVKVIFLVVGIFLSGCASTEVSDKPLYFKKEGATQEEFMRDRYACYQETKQMVSNAYVNQYGGASGAQVMPTCSGLSACLAARGYFKVSSETGNLLVPPSAIIRCSQ